MDSDTQKTLQELKQKVDSLAAEGQTIDAIQAATEYLRKCGELPESDPASIDALTEALETRADLLRASDANEQAVDDYISAIEKLGNRDDRLIQLGRLHAGLGAAYVALDEPDSAARQWERSITCFEKNDPPSPLDIASMSNNFGFLKKGSGDFDAAENAFLKALEILHDELGEHHEETATVASNLGTLYYEADHHEPAGRMHRIAVEAHQKLFGDVHPETARSRSHLARVLAKTGDRTAARMLMEKAIHAFEALGREFHPELQSLAKDYCDLLHADGELSMEQSVARRMRDLVGELAVA